MNIVDATSDDITIQQALPLVGCCAKTLRRAAQDGELPRRYVLSEHGPQLIFRSAELEQWRIARAVRKTSRRGRRPLNQTHSEPAGLVQEQRGPLAKVADLQAALDQYRQAMDRLMERLTTQAQRLNETQAMIASLAARMADSPIPHIAVDVVAEASDLAHQAAERDRSAETQIRSAAATPAGDLVNRSQNGVAPLHRR